MARRLRGVRSPGRRVSARERAPRCARPHRPLSFSNPRRSAGASAGLAIWLPPAKQGWRCARRGGGVRAGTAPPGGSEAGCGRPAVRASTPAPAPTPAS